MEIEDQLDSLRQRLEHNRYHYYERDPANRTLGAFAASALISMEKDSEFQINIADTLLLRPTLTTSHTVKLLERVYQADLLQHDSSYPHGYDSEDAWLSAFEAIESEPRRSEMLALRLLTQSVQSNIAERYKAVKLIVQMYQDRFDGPPSYMDVGTSRMHGPLKLTFDGELRERSIGFGDITLYNDDEVSLDVDPQGGEEVLRRNDSATHLANIALRNTITLSSVIGVDIVDIDDPANKPWVRGCSFYPDELKDVSRVKEFDVLDSIDTARERVRFSQADFSSTADIKNLRKEIDGEQFDVISFSTVFYQVTERQRQSMLVNALQLLSDQGIIIIQDAPSGEFETPYRYSTSIIDSTRHDLGEQEVLRWKNARCNEAILELGKVCLNDTFYTFEEALERTATD